MEINGCHPRPEHSNHSSQHLLTFKSLESRHGAMNAACIAVMHASGGTWRGARGEAGGGGGGALSQLESTSSDGRILRENSVKANNSGCLSNFIVTFPQAPRAGCRSARRNARHARCTFCATTPGATPAPQHAHIAPAKMCGTDPDRSRPVRRATWIP